MFLLLLLSTFRRRNIAPMVNFLALEYRDGGGKTRHRGCLERLERLERAGHSEHSECTIRLVFVQSVIFGKVNDS